MGLPGARVQKFSSEAVPKILFHSGVLHGSKKFTYD